ncbi:MAG: flagellar biosynthesis anti-sigma factor FlgM [Sphingomonas sp.]|uniref:flagellar biosynthesis anti-sigma factor FlgM n=1 Tax=Sphingomonas sp. TaxID=28214 RepID=UPI0012150C04|nr:flagellar biosynthesis anti-sigma factor FlgM [Sphingomonas sp.]THD38273.1 MAG: flagellar biosynthesis anti-sigma factor FlgM [Sphingomonas sp.]
MVDPIGPKGSTPTDLRVAPVASVAVAPKALPVATDGHQPSPVAQLASQLSVQPPVDTDRVARIKRAIADGTFPILPATIADSMLALKYDWMSHDPA